MNKAVRVLSTSIHPSTEAVVEKAVRVQSTSMRRRVRRGVNRAMATASVVTRLTIIKCLSIGAIIYVFRQMTDTTPAWPSTYLFLAYIIGAIVVIGN